MTKAHVESDTGRQLINLILDICHDGELDIAEVEELHIFLRQSGDAFPAIPFLRAHTREIVADGKVDDKEAYNLKKAMERVVPKEVRGVVSEHLSSIGLPSGTFEERSTWRDDPATDRQLEYIVALGGTIRSSMTKGEASEVIDELLVLRPATPRQVMLLRFFDRLDLVDSSKDEVSEWIDAHYSKDERHERAWERFKQATNHDRDCMDPTVVPVGAYLKYKPRVGGACCGISIGIGIGLGIALVIWLVL